MIVMKFGGTSVADADRIRALGHRVAERLSRSPVVVVSALSGVTNALLAAIAAAESRREDELRAGLRSLRERHEAVVAALGLSASRRAEALAAVRDELGGVEDALRGMALLGERTPRATDRVVAAGEILSHRIVALSLAESGLRAEAVDPRELVLTDGAHGCAEPDAAGMTEAARRRLLPLVADGIVPVTGGFVGCGPGGLTTTLGRGGSDWSASLLGAAAGAEEVEIWTDVPGLMSADPKVVPAARTLLRVSFAEAAELATFGARVLHPATIRPAVERGIPVRIKDSLQPHLPGTLIDGEGEPASGPLVRAVAWRQAIATVSLSQPRMLGAHGFLARVFAVFDRHATPVDVVTTSEVSVSVTVDRLERLPAIERDLAELCTVRVERDKALACVVGRGLLESPRIAGDVLAAIHPARLSMFCLGSSDINLTLVLDAADAAGAVRRIHARFLEDAPA